ncbi:MAG: zinc-dependent alcohol dehydrogenase family protein [Planctomycetota bacterium]|jgi:propanol-preferring alcohol dehydrogenase
MKACLLQRSAPVLERPLVFGEVDTPALPAGHVLVRVRVCGLCRTDLHVVEGELPVRRSPVIPGHQVVGRIEELGSGTSSAGLQVGGRVGIAWLHCTCGECRFCTSGRENLCEKAEFTGWSRDGGYAEYAVAPADFVYPLPQELTDEQVAPLLCAGIVGYRCLRRCGLEDWKDARLGMYGFGAAAHIGIQIARARGADVYVCTRDRQRHQALAEELGAAWVGDTFAPPPVKLDAAIIYAPAGEIIPAALKALDRGGRLVLGGIHMSPTPPIEYQDLYWERVVCSVANNTRADGRDFLAEAARAGVRTHIQTFPLSEANDALIALKHDAIKGAGVLEVD